MNRNSAALKFSDIAFIGVAIASIAYSILLREYDGITVVHAGYALLIIFLGCLPSLIARVSEKEAGLIPLMPLHGLFYAFTFGLPALSNKTYWLESDKDVISDALLFTIGGLSSLYFGYYQSRNLFSSMKAISVHDISVRQQILVAWIFFGIFLAFQFFPYLKSLPSLEQLAVPSGYLSLGILTLLALGRYLSRLHFLVFIVAICLSVGLGILSGSLAPPVLLLIFIGILFWNKKRRVPILLIIFISLVAVLLNPIKMRYRDVTWYENQSSPSFYDKTILLRDIVLEYYSDPDILEVVDQDASTINRLAHISTFAHVINLTPESVPYWLGESYRTLWTSYIPRALWPDKPQATIGQDFGHRYFLIAENNLFTSINLPWLIELYANFGFEGLLLGMSFVGVLFRFLVQKFRVPVTSPVEHALAVTIMFGLFYAESNFSLMAGGIVSTYIAFLILLYLVRLTNFGANSQDLR